MWSPPKRPRSDSNPIISFAFASPVHSIQPNRSTLSRINPYPSRSFILVCTANRQNPTRPPETPTLPATPKPPISIQPPDPAATSLSLLLLNLVTILWGTQHAVIKLAIHDTPPATLNLSRFLLAALISLPSLPKPSAATLQSYLAGAELSIYLFLGYALQSVSLLTTSASRSGFLLYLNVKLVPLLARFLYGRRITPLTWGSAALALAGTALLTYDGTPPGLGDMWSVLAAAASAMFILRLESAAQHPAKAINAISLTCVSILCAMWSLVTQSGTSAFDVSKLVPTSATGIAAVLYLGVATTALSNYLQTVGQRHVAAERAAVIFAMDPVYGAFFASALLGESLGGRGIVGASCIGIAALLSNRDVGSGLGKRFKSFGGWVEGAKAKEEESSSQEL